MKTTKKQLETILNEFKDFALDSYDEFYTAGQDPLSFLENAMEVFSEMMVGSESEQEAFEKVMSGIDWDRKPSDFEGVTSLLVDVPRAVKSLPIEESTNLYFHKFKTKGQYFILKNNDNHYLVDTQGYDYPRYVVRLPKGAI